MAQLNEKVQKIVDFIKADKVITKYIKKDIWISGSSTAVYPIMVWSNDIEIQLNWNARPNYFKGFIKRIKDTFGLTARFVKYDGSCPNAITIYK